jgi:hypothetical protein
MCQSRVALLYFGSSPRSRNLCRLLLAPAAIRIFSTLFCESFLGCLVPCPGGPIECMCLLTSPMSSAFPLGGWVGFPLWSTMQLFVETIFEAADIPLCSGHQVCSPPRLLPPLRQCRRAAEAFTSGQNVRRCLRMHRVYQPPAQAIGGVGTYPPLDSQPVGCFREIAIFRRQSFRDPQLHRFH